MCYITEKEKRKDHVGFGDILRADLPFIKKLWVVGFGFGVIIAFMEILKHKSSSKTKRLESTKGYLSSSGEACWIKILGLSGRLRGREWDKDFLCVHIQNISPI